MQEANGAYRSGAGAGAGSHAVKAKTVLKLVRGVNALISRVRLLRHQTT